MPSCRVRHGYLVPEEVTEVNFDLGHGCQSTQVGLLTLRLVRIVRASAYLSGKIAQLIHVISRQQVSYQLVDI